MWFGFDIFQITFHYFWCFGVVLADRLDPFVFLFLVLKFVMDLLWVILLNFRWRILLHLLLMIEIINILIQKFFRCRSSLLFFFHTLPLSHLLQITLLWHLHANRVQFCIAIVLLIYLIIWVSTGLPRSWMLLDLVGLFEGFGHQIRLHLELRDVQVIVVLIYDVYAGKQMVATIMRINALVKRRIGIRLLNHRIQVKLHHLGPMFYSIFRLATRCIRYRALLDLLLTAFAIMLCVHHLLRCMAVLLLQIHSLLIKAIPSMLYVPKVSLEIDDLRHQLCLENVLALLELLGERFHLHVDEVVDFLEHEGHRLLYPKTNSLVYVPVQFREELLRYQVLPYWSVLFILLK